MGAAAAPELEVPACGVTALTAYTGRPDGGRQHNTCNKAQSNHPRTTRPQGLTVASEMTGSRRHAALLAAAVLLALATCAASNDATAAPVAPPANSTEDLIASEVDRPWQWTWQTGLGIALALVVSLSTAPGGQGGGYFCECPGGREVGLLGRLARPPGC